MKTKLTLAHPIRILSTAVLLATSLIAGWPLCSLADVPTNGLVAYYSLDGNANDGSTNHNNGTATGVAWGTNRFGTANRAAAFDGSGPRIYVPNSASLQMTNLTVALWVKLAATPAGVGTFVSKWYKAGALAGGFTLETKTGSATPQIHFNFASGRWPTLEATEALPLNQWAFLCATYVGLTGCLYISNRLVGVSSSWQADTLYLGNATLMIGGQDTSNNDTNLINGSIDEVYIFNRALSSTEVGMLFSNQVPASTLAITAQPQSQTVGVGSNATFSVTATGDAPLAYQWRLNNVNLSTDIHISGATNSTLTISNVQFTDAGSYSVLVTNAAGSATSTGAVLTVVSALWPDLEITPTNLHILNAAGYETGNPSVGDTITLQTTVGNTGTTNTPERIELRVFEGNAPTNLLAYNTNSFNCVAVASIINSIPAGGSTTVSIPWTVTGTNRVTTLTVVAEFISNRGRSQTNAQNGTTIALPVGEPSFANNSVARSIQIGTVPPGNYGITVQVNVPTNMVTGVRYGLTGTATYNWGSQQPVLGAQVTVLANNTTYLTRTLADGTWGVTLDALPQGAFPALAQVSDGRLTGETNVTLTVSAGPSVCDLRVTGMRFEGGGVYRYIGEDAWCTNASTVTMKARVRNDGNTAGTNFVVSFKDGSGTLLGTNTITTLSANTDTWVTNTTPFTAATLGDVTVLATADSTGVVTETYENNNTRYAVLHVRQAKPDLIVSSLAASPSSPKAGDTVTITATILNQGAVAVASGTNLATLFNLGGTVTNTVTSNLVANLPPGGSMGVSTTWLVTNGTYILVAKANSATNVAEDYLDNNEATMALTVRAALPNLVPSLGFSPTKPVVGDVVTLVADIYNRGTVPLLAPASFNVAFTIAGTNVGTNTVTLSSDLVVNGKTTTIFAWNSGGAVPGTVTATAQADSSFVVAEESESDNTASASLPIYAATSALSLVGVSPSSYQPYPGNTVWLTATIRNDGGADASDGGTVTFYTNAVAAPNQLGTNSVGAPVTAKGGTRTANLSWIAPSAQTVVIYAVWTKGSQTQTNQCTVTVTPSPAPDLVVYSEFISANPLLPTNMQAVYFSTTVSNRVGSAATNVQVQFSVDVPGGGWAELGVPVVVANLAVGTAVTVTNTTPMYADRSSYVVRVSVSCLQGDQNTGDNAATAAFAGPIRRWRMPEPT